MLSCLRRVRLLLTAHHAAGGFRARHDQAHRRRQRGLPRAALLLPMVAAAGLVLGLRPGEVTRATPPWTWAPLPATAFGSIPSPRQPTMGSLEADRSGGPTLRSASVGTTAPSTLHVPGASGPLIASSLPALVPRSDRAQRDDLTVAASSPTLLRLCDFRALSWGRY